MSAHVILSCLLILNNSQVMQVDPWPQSRKPHPSQSTACETRWAQWEKSQTECFAKNYVDEARWLHCKCLS